MMSLSAKLDKKFGFDPRVLMMTTAERRLILTRMSRLVIAQAKKNVADQKTIDGSPMKPRNEKTHPQFHTKKKMFQKMTKGNNLKLRKFAESDAVLDAEIGFRGGIGTVAYRHHYGSKKLGLTYPARVYPDWWDTSKVPTELNGTVGETIYGGQGCTANQAAMLIRTRMLPRFAFKGKPGGIRPQIRHIMQRVTAKAAGMLIKKWCDDNKNWTRYKLNLPARPILGMDRELMISLRELLIENIHEKFRAKQYRGFLK